LPVPELRDKLLQGHPVTKERQVPNPIAVRLFDAVLGFLLRPRVRRVRRWSFLVTAPLGFLAGRSLGLDLGDGVVLGAVVALLEAAVVVGVALAGARLLGRERSDALLDLLMHPVARRAIVGEIRMLSTFPLALLRRLRAPRGEEFACHRGSHELGLAIALLPAMLAEGAAVHLLLPDAWLWPKVAFAALHVYGVVMLLSWAIGERTHPHRLRDGELWLRSGQLYRAHVTATKVAAVEIAHRRDGQRTGLVPDGDPVRLAVSGRTDVLLRFAAPVRLERPLGEPLPVTELAIAVDDPARFVAAVEAARHQLPIAAAASDDRSALLAWLAPADLAEALA
jgi:hypothetical protein